MWLIQCDSREVQGEKLYLADRTKQKDFFWTKNPKSMMVFKKLEAAQIQAKKYRFNNVKVVNAKTVFLTSLEFMVLQKLNDYRFGEEDCKF